MNITNNKTIIYLVRYLTHSKAAGEFKCDSSTLANNLRFMEGLEDVVRYSVVDENTQVDLGDSDMYKLEYPKLAKKNSL